MKAMIYALILLISLGAAELRAQALPTAPAPLPTDTQLELAKINNVVELMARAKGWYDEGDLRRYTYALERLVQLRPYNGAFMFKLAQAYGQRDMKTPAYDLLLRMQAQGLSYDPSTEPAFEPISTTNAYTYIVEALQSNAAPWGKGKVVTTVKSDVELLESLAYDSKAERFLLGSARTGQVLAVSADGQSVERAKPAKPGDWWGVLALVVDNQRDSIWLASTMLPHFADYNREELGRGVIVRLDLATGELRERYELPSDGKPHLVGALTVAPNSGTVYAVDGVSNQLYRIKDAVIEPLVALPASINLRGIAIDPQERFLYLSDYELGLLAADMNKNEVINLKLDNQNFGGIEHLSWYQDHLIAVQNVNQPKRISRYSLSAEGDAVTRVMPLEANKPDLVEPTVGTLVGDDFYFIANSQRDYYGPDGKLIDGAQPLQRELYQVPANMGMDSLPPPQLSRPRGSREG